MILNHRLPLIAALVVSTGACSSSSGDEGSTTFGTLSGTSEAGEGGEAGTQEGGEAGTQEGGESGDGDGDSSSASSGDGDGDSSSTSSGDGDGDTSSGDGDGDTTSGDGDGDGTSGDGDGDGTSGDGDGDGTSGDGDGDGTSGDGDGDGDPCFTIQATMRDFQSTHTDMEFYWGNAAYTGLVESTLPANKKPVHITGTFPPGGCNCANPMITSVTSFNEWYTDVPNVNVTETVGLPLTDIGGGIYSFSDDTFFPLDGMGWNADVSTEELFNDTLNDLHNFHFTTEIHTQFVYQAGQEFTFTGDDDVWVFINDQLVIDLGGLHGQLSATAVLDTLGLTIGQPYDLDVFHAERRHDGSTFRIDTSIACFFPQ